VFNIAFRTLLCIYLVICISIFINFKATHSGDEGVYQKCSLIVAILFLAVMCGYILILLYMGVRESFKDSPDKTPSPGFATVFLGLKWNGTPNSTFYVIYFMARRIIFAIVAVLLQKYPVFQIFCIVISSTLMIILLQKLKPHAMPHNQ
jgi:hypothetical protein